MTVIRYEAPFLHRSMPGRKQEQPTATSQPGFSIHADRKARQLALAYRIEQAIEDGELRSYADAARRFGASRSRISQVMKLLRLSVEQQEELLLGLRHAAETSDEDMRGDGG